MTRDTETPGLGMRIVRSRGRWTTDVYVESRHIARIGTNVISIHGVETGAVATDLDADRINTIIGLAGITTHRVHVEDGALLLTDDDAGTRVRFYVGTWTRYNRSAPWVNVTPGRNIMGKRRPNRSDATSGRNNDHGNNDHAVSRRRGA